MLGRERTAAKIIQKAFRQYMERKRFKEYEQRYKHSQERIMAAMKIQLFYRSVRREKNVRNSIQM
jgi:hypothetical protein